MVFIFVWLLVRVGLVVEVLMVMRLVLLNSGLVVLDLLENVGLMMLMMFLLLMVFLVRLGVWVGLFWELKGMRVIL